MHEDAISAAATKTTPVDADQIAILDSADSNKLKRLTWASVKAALGALATGGRVGTAVVAAATPAAPPALPLASHQIPAHA